MAGSKPDTGIGNLKIIGIYAACAGLWVLLSDRALCLLFQDPAQIALVGTLKGWVFVAVTSLLLFLLLRRKSGLAVRTDGANAGPSTSCLGQRIITFTALSVVLVVLGGAVYAVVADSIRKQEIERLDIISEFKKEQIVRWLAERQGDIRTCMDSQTVIDALRHFADGTEAVTRGKLAARLERVRLGQELVGIEIFGLDGRVLASAGAAGRHGAELQAAVRQALDQQEPILLDLYRFDSHEPIRMAYVAAVRDTGLAERPAIGVVVLTINPENTLYPMLGSWPVSSGSGETLIVRRDRDDVLFLSRLRYRPDAALSLRFPVSGTDLLAVRALTLESGVYQGNDYRGVAVLAAVRPVRGTPWILIAKIDREEVFAAVRAVGEVCAVLIVVGISVAGALLTMAWRQQRLRDRIEGLDLQDQFAKVAASVPGLICSFRLRPDGTISLPLAGAAMSDLYGLSPAEVADDAGAMFSCMLPGYAERVKASVFESARTMAAWHEEFPILHPVKGGRWIEGHAVPKREACGSTLWHGYLHDVTERKQAEAALARANRLLRARHLSNLALLRAGDEMSYLRAACEIVVAATGHFMMWIGYADQGSERAVLPIAVAGLDEGYLDSIRITWADDEHGRGPTGTAIRTGQPSVCRDMRADPRLGPWRESVAKHGYRSSVALPLIAGSETLGALTVYSAEPSAFPDDEVELLRQIADDLANGISVLRLRSAHAHAEQSLRESEAKLRLFIERAPTALAMFDAEMRYMFASHRWVMDYHLDQFDIIGKSHYDIFPEISERWKDIHRRCLAGATEACDEDPFVRLDGRTDWLRWAIHPWYRDGGEVGGIVAMSEHITEQVESRRTLRKLTLAVDQSPASILITNLDGDIEYVNETFTKVSGYGREEVLGRNPSFLGSGRTEPEVFRALRQTLSQGGAWRGELHNRRKNGEEYIETAWILPIRQQDGSITNYLAIQEDVTDRKRNEAELETYRFHLEDLVSERTRQLHESSRLIEERAAEFADLYNGAPCGYHSLDSTGLFVRINDTELSWLGYCRDEVVGRMRFPDLLDEEGKARFRANFARFLAQGHLYDAEYDLRTKEGRLIPIVLSATAIRGGDGEVLTSRVIVYNLTDIREAEKEARRHARLADAFFEHSVSCLVILDRDYNFLRVNAAYARACRKEIDYYKGRNHFEVYPSDIKLIFDDVVRTKRPFETLTRAFVFPDQPERGVTYWDWTLVPILDQFGEVELLVFSLNEVTQRKRAEEALRESEAVYRTLFDRSPDGIVLIDPETIRPIEFNASAHESLGYSREEFAALRLTDIDAHDSETDIRGRIDRIARNSGGEFEIVHRTRDGEERNRTISVRTLEIQGRTVFHAIWHDITDICRAQHAVAENERRLREITAALGEGLHVIDEQGRVVFSNPAACRLLGWSEDEMVGTVGHQLIHARRPDGSVYPDEDCELHHALLSDRALINHEDVFWTRDGRLLPVSVTLTTIHRNGRVAGAVLAFQDITERRKAEAELKHYRDGLEVLVAERTHALSESNRELACARDKAEAANLAKSTFLANMSHELRTPLSAILGFAQLLEMDTADGKSEEYRISIDHILKNGQHLLALVNDLLDLAKIDAGQLPIRPERIVLADLLSGIEASLQPMAENAEIVLSMQPCDGLPNILADGTKLTQVLLNLGNNAIKYNCPGGRVDITCERVDSEWVQVMIADTGPGIPEERRSELFEPFNRLGRETGAIEGTGIGLALSRRLMQSMGGSIGYSARSEGGSCFHIHIPVFACEGDTSAAVEEISHRPSSERHPGVSGEVTVGGRSTVLCVDDSPASIELIALVIGSIPGTNLLTAGTAEAGIELARRHRPALILMDINLPGKDGFEALAELRRWDETRTIPVFALSAAATAVDIDTGLAAGFERYLTKPYDIHDLMAAVVKKLESLPQEACDDVSVLPL